MRMLHRVTAALCLSPGRKYFEGGSRLPRLDHLLEPADFTEASDDTTKPPGIFYLKRSLISPRKVPSALARRHDVKCQMSNADVK